LSVGHLPNSPASLLKVNGYNHVPLYVGTWGPFGGSALVKCVHVMLYEKEMSYDVCVVQHTFYAAPQTTLDAGVQGAAHCSTSPGVFSMYHIYIFPREEGSLSCLRLTQGLTTMSNTRLYRYYVNWGYRTHALVPPSWETREEGQLLSIHSSLVYHSALPRIPNHLLCCLLYFVTPVSN
jgi:hypothetical protein